MQTPKAKPGSLEVPLRKSPGTTTRTARQLKTAVSESDSVSSPNSAGKNPKERSPKIPERRSPRSPITEKKRPSKVSELEAQLSQLQEDLKKAKDQLNTSDSSKRKAQQEAEDAKKQLVSMSAKLEESQQQLMELSTSEDMRIEELRQVSNDRDKEWESELDAVQKQHSIDSAALASAMNEIQKLKNQLEMAMGSEATHTKHAESAHAEMQSLRIELTETLTLVEKLKTEVTNARESEAQALELVRKSEEELESANGIAEMLRLDGAKAAEAYDSLLVKLDESRAQVKYLEEVASKLRLDLSKIGGDSSVKPVVELHQESGDDAETNSLKEVNVLKVEISQLRSALEASEAHYQEEYIQSTLQIRSAYEQVDQTKQELGIKVAQLEAELNEARANIVELKANLMDKETELQGISEENAGLTLKLKAENSHPGHSGVELEMTLKKLEADLEEMKARILEKEAQLQNLTEQNEMLQMKIQKGETERNNINDEAAELAEVARTGEREALMKLGHATEEADKSSRRVARVSEQLDAAQAVNTEMEAELRKLKVQSDQWRKAAEAAAAMLSTGNNGKLVERTGSLDSHYAPSVGMVMDSPYSEDMEDDSPKKKNGNMLKKIGVLWKKGQKQQH